MIKITHRESIGNIFKITEMNMIKITHWASIANIFKITEMNMIKNNSLSINW